MAAIIKKMRHRSNASWQVKALMPKSHLHHAKGKLMAASEWLEEWIDTNLNTPLYHERKEDMRREADSCRVEAEAAGIATDDLEEAAGGDLLAYLFDRQNALTNAEVNRLVAKDD
jgi:hypothetical protein